MGGEGDDWAYGGEGRDWIHGIAGSDHLEGGDGNDRVNGTFYCDTASSAGDRMGDTSHNQVYGGMATTRSPGTWPVTCSTEVQAWTTGTAAHQDARAPT